MHLFKKTLNNYNENHDFFFFFIITMIINSSHGSAIG